MIALLVAAVRTEIDMATKSIPSQSDGEDHGAAVSASPIDKVTDAITQGIRSGVFVPGQHLLEPDLTRRLGISRGSLREALKHLAAAGIVTLNRYRGAYIGILDRKSVLDLLDTLEPLARLAARLAATHCTTAAKRKRMEEASVKIEAAGRSGPRGQYLEQRRHFYDTMIALGENWELARVMPLSRTDLFRAQIETVQSDDQRQRHVAGYGKIARAIIEQDADTADRAIKKHFDGTRKTIMELPPEAFPPPDADRS
jgi:DNA-binding GntR family transcriptional regulator